MPLRFELGQKPTRIRHGDEGMFSLVNETLRCLEAPFLDWSYFDHHDRHLQAPEGRAIAERLIGLKLVNHAHVQL